MIDGVVIKDLRVITDERGFLMEIMRNDDPMFETFGQVYMTTAYPGVVKGWHYHKEQIDHITVLHGMAKIVLYDMRESSPTHGEIQELFIGERNRILVRIPTLVAHGMKGIGTEPAFMLNVPNKVYNYESPDEFRIPPHSGNIPYDWSRQDG